MVPSSLCMTDIPTLDGSQLGNLMQCGDTAYHIDVIKSNISGPVPITQLHARSLYILHLIIDIADMLKYSVQVCAVYSQTNQRSLFKLGLLHSIYRTTIIQRR